MDDKGGNEDLKIFIKSALEGMTKHFIEGFELLVIQLWSKSTPGSSSSTPHDEGKTNGETIFQRLDLITYLMSSKIRMDLQYPSFQSPKKSLTPPMMLEKKKMSGNI